MSLIKNYQNTYTYTGKGQDGGYHGDRWTCRNKIHAIAEKTGTVVSVLEVTYLCEMWASESGLGQGWTREHTVSKIENSSPENLKKDIERMRKKKGILLNYLNQERRVTVNA